MNDQSHIRRFEQLRKLAESHLAVKAEAPAALPHDISELIHELEVHQIELEIQNAELQQAYVSLEKSRAQYTDLFDFAPVGYLITDRDGVILNVNLTAAAMLSVGRQELIQSRFASFLDKDDKDTYYIHRRAALRSRQSQSCEVCIVRRNRSTFYALLNIDILTQDEDLCRMSITNIAQIKHAEDVLRQNLFREKELNELKTRLINMISHEFRTPLSTILSSIELLERYSDDSDERQRNLQTIRNTVWHLNDVVNDVLLAHQVGDDPLMLRPETFDIVAFVRQLIEDLQVPDADGRIVFISNKEAGTSAMTMDQHMLRRIVNNLLQNALRYSDDTVEVHLQLESNSLTFQVTDHGPGIAEEDQPYIYTMFYRGNAGEKIPGTGVGLAIVKRAVETLGGVISFTTRARQGTTFVVRLPYTAL